MQLFNRAVVLVLALALLIVALALLAAPDTVLEEIRTGLSKFEVVPASGMVQAAAITAAAALLISLLELWPSSKRSFAARIGNEIVEYSAETVVGTLERDLASVEGVRKLRAEVVRRGQKVETHVTLMVEPNYDVQAITAATASHVRQKLEQGLGLQLARMRLTVRPTEGGRSVEQPHIQPVAVPPAPGPTVNA